MTDIKVGLVPLGRISDGSYSLLLDENDNPLASVMEVLEELPSDDDANNFPGRLVFVLPNRNVYVFTDDPADDWIPVRSGQVQIDDPAPEDLELDPVAGDLYYSLDLEIMYLFDGDGWVEVGGLRGANVIWRFYVGDGSTDIFDTGATTYPPVEYVQVFIDGVALSPGTSSIRDYYMVGNTVQLNGIPEVGEDIAIRTLTYITMARNSTFITLFHEADGDLNDFDAGSVQLTNGQVTVVMDGITLTPDTGSGNGTFDYRVKTQNVNIDSLEVVGSTIVATTEAAHGFSIGDPIRFYGSLEAGFNDSFTVTQVISSTSLSVTFADYPGASEATPNPQIYFGPVRRNDWVEFYDADGDLSPPPDGSKIYIKTIANVVAESASGEINTASNTGGGYGIFSEKVGTDLKFKSIVAGNRVSVTDNGTSLQIDTDAERFVGYSTFNGIPSTLVVTDQSYIACKNSSGSSVTIDLSGISGGGYTGRKIVVKDEARNAATYNISISPGMSSSIEGGSDGVSYVLATNGQSVELVYDGSDWSII